jgi:hypothetical protein
MATVGQPVKIVLSVFDQPGQKIVDLAPLAELSLEGSGLQEAVSLGAVPEETLQGTIRPEKAGTYNLSVRLPGVDGVFEEYILVTAH